MSRCVLSLILGLILTAEVEAQVDPDPTYVLSVGSASGVSGGSAQVSVFLDSPDGEPLLGFWLGVCASPDDLVESPCVGSSFPNDCVEQGIVEFGADLAATNGGAGPDFWVPRTDNLDGNGWGVDAIISLLGADSLAPQEAAEIVVAHYELVGPPGSTAELAFCDTEDGMPTDLFVGDGKSIFPETVGGTLSIVAASFIRGDVDADGVFNAMTDVIFLLRFTFLPGAEAPLCLASADVDGNGALNGLVDALCALNYQFVPGSVPPANPFPECGPDPSPDGQLGCHEFPGCDN